MNEKVHKKKLEGGCMANCEKFWSLREDVCPIVRGSTQISNPSQ